VAGGAAEFELRLWRERLAQEVERGDRAHGVTLSERLLSVSLYPVCFEFPCCKGVCVLLG
jgi:hypothetical protein